MIGGQPQWCEQRNEFGAVATPVEFANDVVGGHACTQ
jgi:hypothetical protein